MKSKWLERLLRTLLALLGAGLGAALSMGIVQVIHMAQPALEIPLQVLVIGYSGLILLGLLLFAIFSRRMLGHLIEAMASIENAVDKLTLPQIFLRCCGLIIGLVIASLLTNILRFMGSSMFTTIFSMILYVLLGFAGYTIGRKRTA